MYWKHSPTSLKWADQSGFILRLSTLLSTARSAITQSISQTVRDIDYYMALLLWSNHKGILMCKYVLCEVLHDLVLFVFSFSSHR